MYLGDNNIFWIAYYQKISSINLIALKTNKIIRFIPNQQNDYFIASNEQNNSLQLISRLSHSLARLFRIYLPNNTVLSRCITTRSCSTLPLQSSVKLIIYLVVDKSIIFPKQTQLNTAACWLHNIKNL